MIYRRRNVGKIFYFYFQSSISKLDLFFLSEDSAKMDETINVLGEDRFSDVTIYAR